MGVATHRADMTARQSLRQPGTRLMNIRKAKGPECPVPCSRHLLARAEDRSVGWSGVGEMWWEWAGVWVKGSRGTQCGEVVLGVRCVGDGDLGVWIIKWAVAKKNAK